MTEIKVKSKIKPKVSASDEQQIIDEKKSR